MSTFSHFVASIFAKITGETAPAKIARKQAEIDAVITKNSQAISTAIDAEIEAIRHAVQQGMGRINDLAATGAMNRKVADALEAAGLAVDSALVALEKAI